MLYAILVEGQGPLGSVFSADDFTDREVARHRRRRPARVHRRLGRAPPVLSLADPLPLRPPEGPVHRRPRRGESRPLSRRPRDPRAGPARPEPAARRPDLVVEHLESSTPAAIAPLSGRRGVLPPVFQRPPGRTPVRAGSRRRPRRSGIAGRPTTSVGRSSRGSSSSRRGRIRSRGSPDIDDADLASLPRRCSACSGRARPRRRTVGRSATDIYQAPPADADARVELYEAGLDDVTNHNLLGSGGGIQL